MNDIANDNMKTWEGVLLDIIDDNYGLNKIFTRKDLMENHMSTIEKLTNTIGKTPDMTMNRTLQVLRDMGYLKFYADNGKKGTYMLIKPIQTEQVKKRSKGEMMINCILSEFKKKVNMKIEEQKMLNDCRSRKGGYLSFDFYITFPDLTDKQLTKLSRHLFGCYDTGKQLRAIAIEFDGLQHEKPISIFGGEDSFKYQIERDKIKNRYCKKHNIYLIRLNKLHIEIAKEFLKYYFYV